MAQAVSTKRGFGFSVSKTVKESATVLTTAAATLVFLFSSSSFAWGERGHHTICEVATKLVKNPQLKAFLAMRSETMGHICNIPDIWWRDLGDQAKIGDAAHFMNPQNVGLDDSTVPVSIKDYYSHDTNAADDTFAKKQERMGSLFWRAQQLYDLSVRWAYTASQSPTPKNRLEDQQNDLAYNQAVIEFETDLGLLGHFVGDASMPLHTNADYDGWGTGHGGLHAFYETLCVSTFDFALSMDVMNRALQSAQLGELTPAVSSTNQAILKTREVTLVSASELPAMLAADHVQQMSTASTPNSRGQGARRQPLELACPAFHTLIVNEMARSAAALAQLWDQAYVDGHSPDLGKYRSYKYPLTPDFIPLDYLNGL